MTPAGQLSSGAVRPPARAAVDWSCVRRPSRGSSSSIPTTCGFAFPRGAKTRGSCRSFDASPLAPGVARRSRARLARSSRVADRDDASAANVDDPTDARASPPLTSPSWTPPSAKSRRARTRLTTTGEEEDETGEEEDETGEEEDETGERDATSDANDEASTPLSTSTLSSSSSSSSGSDWNTIGPGLIPSVATACLGAFLYGYHSAVINAPLSAIADDLGFAGDNFRKGVIVSVLVAGGFLGGLSIGPLADKEGRRAALAATTVPLAVGTLISAGANSFTTMALGRLITGVGVGASSQIVPLYLSEVSPPELRGTVNGVRRVAYVLGCLLAFQFAVPLQRPVATDVEETRGRVIHADRAAPGLSKNAEDANEAAKEAAAKTHVAKAPVAKAPVAADAKIAPEIAVAAKPSGEPSSAYAVDANVPGESSVAVASPNASKSSQVSGTADPTSIVAVKSTKPSAEAVSTAEGVSAAEGGFGRGGGLGRGGGFGRGGGLGRFGLECCFGVDGGQSLGGPARGGGGGIPGIVNRSGGGDRGDGDFFRGRRRGVRGEQR